MIFSGHTGTGKTFMANCVMSELLDRGKEVLFMPANALFKPFAVYENEERETMNDLRDMIYSCDLLIIDDLGAEFSTQLTVSSLYNIVNCRGLEDKPTVISTNLNPEAIKDTYSDRIASRILSTYTILQFDGADIRQLKTI